MGISFVQNNKYGIIFIWQHTDCQLDQRTLLKMHAFFHCIFLASLSKISMWFYFWIFYSITLINLTVSVQIPCSFFIPIALLHSLRSGMLIPPELFLLLSLVFAFFFLNEFQNCTFYVYEEMCCDFDGDCIESIDCLW